MKNIHINQMQLMSVRNYPGKDGDMFAIEIEGSMIDYTIRESDGTFVSSPIYRNKYESLEHYENRAKTQSVPFTEYYILIRVGNVWKLNNIKSKFSIIKDKSDYPNQNLNKFWSKKKNRRA